MMINGSYTFPQWKIDAPNFNYGVASQPVPNSGKTSPFNYTAGGGNYWVYAKTQQPAIVGDIMSYAGSEAGQIALINIIGGSQPSVFAKANAIATLSPQAKKALALFDQQIRLAPSPAIRNPDTALVDLELHAVTPDFGATVQGIFTGQLSDAKKAMQDLKTARIRNWIGRSRRRKRKARKSRATITSSPPGTPPVTGPTRITPPQRNKHSDVNDERRATQRRGAERDWRTGDRACCHSGTGFRDDARLLHAQTWLRGVPALPYPGGETPPRLSAHHRHAVHRTVPGCHRRPTRRRIIQESFISH